LAQLLMVVYLTVHGENVAVEAINKRLGSVLHIHDGESLVLYDCPLITVNATPVGSSVTDLLDHGQGLVPQLRVVGTFRVKVENGENATH